jgi:hypothetical protein
VNSLDLHLNGDGAFPELADGRKVHHLGNGAKIAVASLEGGMQSGMPSVCFKFDLEDGSSVLAETSWRLFWAVAVAFRAKYGEPE